MRLGILVAAASSALCLPLPAGAAPAPSFGAGGSVQAGSAGYWRVGVTGDAQWTARPWTPYAWTQFSSDQFVSGKLELGGGTWRDLSSVLRVKGGLSYAHGTYRGTGLASSAVTFETGVERELGRATLGGEYLYSSGALGAASAALSAERGRRGELRRRAVTTEPAAFHDHQLAAYARVYLPRGVLGLRLGADFPSDLPDVRSQTLSWKLALPRSCWATPSLTFQEDGGVNLILGVFLYHAFD